MNKLCILFLLLSINHTCCLSTCLQYLRRTKPNYYLTKECAISKMRTVASSNATSLDSCIKLATEKNAFAFTFANNTKELILSSACNVFECPEFHSFLLKGNESVYDYYSLYSKPLPSENFTCAPGIGMFEIITQSLNYSNAMIACEDNGGHLANVVSDSRTSFLAALVSSTLINQTITQRKAFVGLFFENDFVTITGLFTLAYLICFMFPYLCRILILPVCATVPPLPDAQDPIKPMKREPLSCLPFRAWAPGHPKTGRLKKDCVVITSTRYWETQDCSIKLPYICELIPDGPISSVERYCAPITNIQHRKKCILRNHKQFEHISQTKKQCIGQTEVINNNN